jgi:hypothetical protein
MNAAVEIEVLGWRNMPLINLVASYQKTAKET